MCIDQYTRLVDFLLHYFIDIIFMSVINGTSSRNAQLQSEVEIH